MSLVRQIFREYVTGLGIDLAFQDFDLELEQLPGEYAAPRGALRLALVGGELAGCCGLRPLHGVDGVDVRNTAEMKRLYVRPAYRGRNLGRELAQTVLDAAWHIGYDSVVLDTLDEMKAARSIYADLGFGEIPAYYHNPLPGVHYLKRDRDPA